MELTGLDRDAGEVTLAWNQVSDPERTRAAIAAGLRSMAKKLGRPPPSDAELPEFAFRDRSLYVFDLKTGLPRTVEWSRTTTTNDQRRVDGLSFTLSAAKTAT